MKDKLLLTRLLLALALGSSIPIPLAQAAANDAARPAGNTDSGAQLNRTREYLERQNIARKIQEGWEKNTVEGTAASEKREADAVRFVLSEVEIPLQYLFPLCPGTGCLCCRRLYDGKQADQLGTAPSLRGRPVLPGLCGPFWRHSHGRYRLLRRAESGRMGLVYRLGRDYGHRPDLDDRRLRDGEPCRRQLCIVHRCLL